MSSLKGLNVIITGASTGIGKGIAIAFASAGANLVLASRDETKLSIVAATAKKLGSSVLVVPTDVTVEAQVVKLFATTMDSFNSVDVLVNNAGTFDGGPLEDIKLETWKKVVDLNLTAPFLCTKSAMKIMKQQRSGKIINIGSISAEMPRMNSAPYTSTKHALVGLTKSTSLEGRDFGISASCLNPGNIKTEWRQKPEVAMNQEAMMEVEDFANIVVTVASLPTNVNMLSATILPVEQAFIGRG